MVDAKTEDKRPLLSFVGSSGDNVVGQFDTLLAAAFVGGAIYFAVAGNGLLAAIWGGFATYLTLHILRVWITVQGRQADLK